MIDEWSIRDKVAIVGVGYSDVGRRLERPLGLLARDAALAAIADAGLQVSDIDGLSGYPDMPRVGSNVGGIDGEHVVTTEYMAKALRNGNQVSWFSQRDYRGLMIGSVIEAVNAIAVGACHYALVWRAMHMPRARYHRYEYDSGDGMLQYAVPYGVLQPSVGEAITYRRYLHESGATREALGKFLVNNRKNAQLNTNVNVFRGKDLTLDTYMNAPRIFDPLTMYDCDMPVDGCGAFVLTSAERARDLPNPPAYIRGYGLSTATGNGERFYQMANLDYMREAGGSLARTLYASARLTPIDIQAAMLYDGFSSFVLSWLEVLGICGKNEAWRMISDGSTNIDGRFPVNTNGGCQGEGRTHGPGQLSEGVYQIRGSAGLRQVAEIENVVVTCGPPILQGSALILSRGN